MGFWKSLECVKDGVCTTLLAFLISNKEFPKLNLMLPQRLGDWVISFQMDGTSWEDILIMQICILKKQDVVRDYAGSVNWWLNVLLQDL